MPDYVLATGDIAVIKTKEPTCHVFDNDKVMEKNKVEHETGSSGETSFNSEGRRCVEKVPPEQ